MLVANLVGSVAVTVAGDVDVRASVYEPVEHGDGVKVPTLRSYLQGLGARKSLPSSATTKQNGDCWLRVNGALCSMTAEAIATSPGSSCRFA